MKILIAEDDRTTRSLLEQLLTGWNHEVSVATDGQEALQILLSFDAPSLAILDWVMPEMDGVEVCRKVREQRLMPPIYLILLTVRGGKKDVVTGLEAGANDYLSKPFDEEELRARLHVGQRVVELQTALAERVEALEAAMAHIKRLQGLLPICIHCHKIRNDRESWERIEKYITEHSEAKFTHSICPDCLAKHYPSVGRE
jgi:DNA-binding response OmpR family regulator